MPWANTDDKLQHLSRAASETLTRNKETIMAAWGSAAKRYVLHEHDLPTESQLRNSLPKLLDNLAAALKDPHWTYREGRNVGIARYHGFQRHHLQRYSLAQMIDEYAILRKVIITAIQQENRWPVSIMSRLHAFIDAAIRGAAEEFSQQQRHLEVTEVKDALEATSEDRDAHRALVSQLEEEKGLRARFVALLTHDLNNPLTAIKLNCQRIAKKCDDPDLMLQLAERMQQAISRMEQMIKDMLDTTRLQAGQSLPLRVAHCDMADIASRAIESVASSHADSIDRELPSTLMGNWDAEALRRAMENLLGNALKYGSSGTRVRVVLKTVGDSAHFAVRNFGPPVPAEELATLFDVYARAKAAHAGKQQGWGLGLYLVRAVAEAHGGKVGVTSDASSGTCFWIEIPLDGPAKASL